LEGRVFQNIFMKEVNDQDRRAWYVAPSTFQYAFGNWGDVKLMASWRSAIKTLTNLSSIPLELLSIPSSFAPSPTSGDKPYFPRQVNSLLRVSEAQSKARSKEGVDTGEIWGTKELRPYFTEGARGIAEDERKRGVGSIVHGDFKMDNLVSLY
jgi:hypothetical protein